MEFTEYIKPELLVLVPVLYFIGVALKKSDAFTDNYIPLALGAISIILCWLWVFSQTETSGNYLTAIFTAITQGVLIAGASVYTNEIIKQLKE